MLMNRQVHVLKGGSSALLHAKWKRRLTAFYALHKPEKVKQVDELLIEYKVIQS